MDCYVKTYQNAEKARALFVEIDSHVTVRRSEILPECIGLLTKGSATGGGELIFKVEYVKSQSFKKVLRLNFPKKKLFKETACLPHFTQPCKNGVREK